MTRRVSLPEVFQRLWEQLCLHGGVAVASVADETELVGVPLFLEDFRHPLVRQDPIVHVVAHDIGIEEVPVSNTHPNA